jgi:hypothetical protein
MRVHAKNFSSMKGHVAHECEIIASNKRVFTLKNTLRGWSIFNDKNEEISGNLKGHFEVEFFVVNGLGV